MRPIPIALRKQLAVDPYMAKCQYRGCGKQDVEWNHAILYCGRQLNTWYAIIPLCTYHHRGNFGTIWPEVKAWCELEAIKRSNREIEKDCPRVNWEQRKVYLEKITSK